MKPHEWVLRGLVAGTLILGAAATAHAAGPHPGLRALLEKRAPLLLEGVGPHRLVLPPEVAAEVRADLADLRIVDDAQRSIPFEVLPPSGEGSITSVTLPRLTTLDRSYGEKRRPSRERLVFDAPGAPIRFDAIEIPLRGRQSFVGRVDVEVERPDGTMHRIATGAPLFRLSAWGRSTAENTRIEVPRTTARRLILDIHIQEGTWVAPSGVTLLTRHGHEPPRGHVALEETRRSHGARVTRIGLRVPPGITLDGLVLESSTETFLRPVRVLNAKGTVVGGGAIARLMDDRGEAHERLQLSVRDAPHGEITVEIEDAGEAMLADLSVQGVARLPTLVIAVPPSGQARLYWKSDRLHYPAHGSVSTLAQVIGALAAHGLPTEIAERDWLWGLPEARLGTLTRNPYFEAEPQLFTEVRPGAVLDPAPWTHRRVVEFTPSEAGLTTWTLSLQSRARLRADLADLRVVDDQMRQLPYVVVQAPSVPVPLQVGTVEHRGGITTIELTLPTRPVAAEAVELAFEEQFFDRSMRLRGHLEGQKDPILLASWQALRRDTPNLQRQVLTHSGGRRIRSLSLEIVDGDDAPLTITRARLGVDGKRVIVAGAAGTHRVLLGNARAEAPRYDVASARDLLAALPASDAAVAPLTENPDRAKPGIFDDFDLGTAALWGVIALTILVLVVLSLRLAKSPDE